MLMIGPFIFIRSISRISGSNTGLLFDPREYIIHPFKTYTLIIDNIAAYDRSKGNPRYSIKSEMQNMIHLTYLLIYCYAYAIDFF